MRQRGQVAGRADRTFGRDPGVNFGIDHGNQRLNDAQADAGETARQAVDFQHHHQTHNVVIQRLADARRVGEHQRTLQVFQIVSGDARLRQQAKTGVDPVGGAPFGDNRFHAGDAVVDGLVGRVVER